MAMPLTEGSALASSFDWPVLMQIAVFFAEAGAFVFGSGLAIVPFLYAASSRRTIGSPSGNSWMQSRWR